MTQLLMEFSFFLVVLSILLVVLFNIGKYAIVLSKKLRLILIAFLLIGGLFAFVSLWVGLSISTFFLLTFLIKDKAFFRKPLAFWANLLFAPIILFLLLAYLPNVSTIWNSISGYILQILGHYSLLQEHEFINVYQVIQFFRYYYPAIVVGVIYYGFCKAVNYQKWDMTFGYRYVKKFDHRQVFLTVISTIAYFVAVVVKAPFVIRVALLNFAIFFAIPYAVYGFLTLLYALKRKVNLSYTLGMILMYLILIISGRAFIFTLILAVGIGISDIWMNYHKRVIKIF